MSRIEGWMRARKRSEQRARRQRNKGGQSCHRIQGVLGFLVALMIFFGGFPITVGAVGNPGASQGLLDAGTAVSAQGTTQPDDKAAQPAGQQDGTQSGDNISQAGSVDRQNKISQAEGDQTGQLDGSDKKDSSQSDSQSPGDGDPTAAVNLVIDNRNIYDGMDRPYCEGYVPRVENGSVLVVIPMLPEGETAIRDNHLRVSLNLGESMNTPFVYKNYDKNISLQAYSVNGGTGIVESYVASFWLELLPDRINGSYPVTLAVEGADTAGNPISQNFIVYVTIRDGKDPNAEPEPEPEPEEPPTFAPKLLVQSYRYSREEILAGDQVTAEITLLNTSKTERIKNMTVTVSAPGEQLTLLSPTDSVYIESVKAGETCVVSFDYQVNVAALAGQYDLTLAMDYADAKGMTYTGSGKARLSIKQPVEMQFDPIVLPNQLEIGDVTQVQVQAMNLGRSKVYHVRAELAADGLTPQGTIFIGDMEAGTMAAGSTQISVGGLTEGSSSYGETQGTVTFYYEDEAGQEQSQQLTFTTMIASPFSGQPKEEVDDTSQWWVILVVILALLCCCVAVIMIRAISARKRRAQEE